MGEAIETGHDRVITSQYRRGHVPGGGGAKAEDMARAVGAAREPSITVTGLTMSHDERALPAEARQARGERKASSHQRDLVGPDGRSSIHGQSGGARVLETTSGTYATRTDAFRREEQATAHERRKVGLLVREPGGPVGAIIPWNGPHRPDRPQGRPAIRQGCHRDPQAYPEAPG